jgi:hypothetical protein
MEFLRRFGSKKRRPALKERPSLEKRLSSNPYATTVPTRRPRPDANMGIPPPYSPVPFTPDHASPTQKSDDSPYAFLKEFDAIFLIDDSGSMVGESWRETAAALASITPICTSCDPDGIDIYFLNHRCPSENQRHRRRGRGKRRNEAYWMDFNSRHEEVGFSSGVI